MPPRRQVSKPVAQKSEPVRRLTIEENAEVELIDEREEIYDEAVLLTEDPEFPVIGGILQEASDIISGQRREEYGHPVTSFERIAAGWEVIFDVEISAFQVAIAMDWLKTCRALNTHEHGATESFRDSLRDKAGYTALAAVLAGIDQL